MTNNLQSYFQLLVNFPEKLHAGKEVKVKISVICECKAFLFKGKKLFFDVRFVNKINKAETIRKIYFGKQTEVLLGGESLVSDFLITLPALVGEYEVSCIFCCLDKDSEVIRFSECCKSNVFLKRNAANKISIKKNAEDLQVFSFNDIKAASRRAGVDFDRNLTYGMLGANKGANSIFEKIQYDDGRLISEYWKFELKPINGKVISKRPQNTISVSAEAEEEIRKAPWAPAKNKNQGFGRKADLSFSLIELNDVTLVLGNAGFTLIRDNLILKESAAIPAFLPEDVQTPCKEIDVGVWCSGRTKHNNIYHSLLDDAARAWLMGPNVPECSIFYFYDYSIAYSKYTLEKVVDYSFDFLEKGKPYYFKKLYMLNTSISGMGSPAVGFNMDYINHLRSRLTSPSNINGGGRRLYVCRKDALTREMLNDAQVAKLLGSYGFEIITMTDYSPQEQIDMFSSASIIVAQHGAALANLIFCNNKAKVVELFSPIQASIAYFKISSLLGLDYHALLGERCIDDNSKKQGWFVDISKIEAVVKSFGLVSE